MWDGKGNDGTQHPAGTYKLTATAKDSNGKDVGIATEIQGIVDSVDLTATPPLLSIGGANYTTDQIRRVIRPSTAAAARKPQLRASPVQPPIAIPARPGVSQTPGRTAFGGHFQGDSY